MKNELEMEMDLQDLLLYLLKKTKIIVSLVLLCAAIAFLVSSRFLPVEYTASTRIYVLNREEGIDISYSDYQIANQMIEDYKVLITGANVTQAVVEKLDLEISKERLEKMIQLEAPKNTRFLEISITDTDPNRAVLLANAVREIACTEIKRIMDVEAVNLVYEAELPQKPSGPPVLKITILTSGVALFVLLLFYSIRHMTDDSIRTDEDVSARLGLNVLAVLPNSDKIKKQNGASYGTINRK